MLVTMINGIPWWYFHRLGGPHQGRQVQSVDPAVGSLPALDPSA